MHKRHFQTFHSHHHGKGATPACHYGPPGVFRGLFKIGMVALPLIVIGKMFRHRAGHMPHGPEGEEWPNHWAKHPHGHRPPWPGPWAEEYTPEDDETSESDAEVKQA